MPLCHWRDEETYQKKGGVKNFLYSSFRKKNKIVFVFYQVVKQVKQPKGGVKRADRD
jgi:hypothetical protein